MDSKIDALLARLERGFEGWLGNLESHPLRTGFKTLLVLYTLRWVKKNLL